MSKKMLKRSLALGALMAFVITGSAMAAELTIDYDNGTYTATGTGIQGSLEFNQDGLYSGLKAVNWAGSLNTYNNSVHEWNGNTSAYGGGFGENKSSTGNTIKVHGGDFKNRIIAGYTDTGDANGNALYFNGSVSVGGEYIEETHTLTNKIVGGWGMNDASNNSVYVKDATLVAGIDGGDAQKGNAEGNVIEIEDSTVTYVAAGTARYENGNGNTINNKVIITNSIGNGGGAAIWGGCTNGYGNSVGNSVTINDSKIKAYIVGGHSSKGDAIQNEVVINGENTVTDGQIFGGRAQYSPEGEGSSAINNVVTINNGTINGKVFGGAGNGVEGNGNDAATQSKANANTVNINGGIINGIVYGGNNEEIGIANDNIVNITGGTINNNVYGGYGVTEANNNTVNISGEADVASANIYGGYVTSNTGVSTGNTLNIGDGWTDSIGSVQNFNNVNFGKGSSVTTDVTLGTGATINLANGDDYIDGNYAINGELEVDSANATLTIGNIKETTYNIASEYNDTDTTWTLENDLMNVKEWTTNGQLQVTVEAKSATQIAESLGVSEGTASLVEDIISNDNANAEAVQFVENVMNSGASKEEAKEAYAAMEKMAEAGGQSATAARIVNNVTGVTNDRLSFNCGHSAPHKGGHGVGLFEEGSGADIWVEYVHGKDKVEDMKSSNGASSYEGQYNGFVMGVDFKKVNKFQSGIAFNYGEGDTNSVGSSARTHSDYDFWGVGYYGNIHNDDSNVIFDINYAKTDSDVTQNSAGGILEASPETTTLSAGVKVEKLYQNENVQIVPYTGLRFMSIDTDDYATKGGGFMYNMERQNIWLLPVGVSIKQEIVNDNGWVVSPRVDLSYIWAFGDTNSNMEVKSGNGISPIWYDIMDDGSFLGLVGIEAHKGQWGYGVAYSYQKGDHSESKKWFIDVNYSF